MEIQRASIEARLKNDIGFADRERDTQLTANQEEIAALDKSGKDYQQQLQTLNDKALEIQQQHDTKVAELTSRASVEAAQRDLANTQESERAKIEATDRGSAERLAAINAALKEEDALNLQNTSYYRDLLNQRIQTTQEMLSEQTKIAEEAGKEEADRVRQTGALAVAAEKERNALIDAARHVSDEARMQQEVKIAGEEFRYKQEALQKEIAALDKSGKDYTNKLKELQDKEKELVQEHENEVTAIKDKAEMERNQRILSAETRFNDVLATQMTQMLMRHETFGKMMVNIGDQVVSGMIENAIKSMLADDMTKEKDAAAAARKMFLAGTHFPFPANIVMAPALGAMAFAAVMAFQGGTDRVPGVGHGDTVPARLEPGEGVVPGGVMDGLRKVARNGGFNNAPHQTHIHVRPTYNVNTIDGDGMREALNKHTDVLEAHFHNAVRKMNR